MIQYNHYSDSTLRERAAATVVWTAMKVKTKIGMGLKLTKKKKKSKQILLTAKRDGVSAYSTAARHSRVIGWRGRSCQGSKR